MAFKLFQTILGLLSHHLLHFFGVLVVAYLEVADAEARDDVLQVLNLGDGRGRQRQDTEADVLRLKRLDHVAVGVVARRPVGLVDDEQDDP